MVPAKPGKPLSMYRRTVWRVPLFHPIHLPLAVGGVCRGTALRRLVAGVDACPGGQHVAEVDAVLPGEMDEHMDMEAVCFLAAFNSPDAG